MKSKILFSFYSILQRGGGGDKINVGVRLPYIRVIGINVDTLGMGRSRVSTLSPAEEDEFRHMASNPRIYDLIAQSIAPSIYGCIDMKKAIACLLFGGSRKRSVFYVCYFNHCTICSKWTRNALVIYAFSMLGVALACIHSAIYNVCIHGAIYQHILCPARRMDVKIFHYNSVTVGANKFKYLVVYHSQ